MTLLAEQKRTSKKALESCLWSRSSSSIALRSESMTSTTKKIYEYDPPGERNHRNRALYCLQKGNHLYTLNHGIKALQQLQPTEQETVSHDPLIFPLSATSSSDLRIAQDTQDTLNIIQDIKTYTRASELNQEEPLQITEVFVLQSNFEKALP